MAWKDQSPIRQSKFEAMLEYLRMAQTAEDRIDWMDAMEHMMNVVGSEVQVGGGVVPSYEKAQHCWDCVRPWCEGFQSQSTERVGGGLEDATNPRVRTPDGSERPALRSVDTTAADEEVQSGSSPAGRRPGMDP